MSEKENLIRKLKRMGKSDLEISQLLGDYSLLRETKFTSNPAKREVSYVRK